MGTVRHGRLHFGGTGTGRADPTGTAGLRPRTAARPGGGGGGVRNPPGPVCREENSAAR